MAKEGKKRKRVKEKQRRKHFPYYLVFVFDYGLVEQMNLSGLAETLQGGILYFSENRNCLPKECTDILDIRGNSGYILDRKKKTEKCFTPDIYVRQNVDMCYLQLANTELDLGKNESVMWRIVELYLPAVGKSYDTRIPRNRRIGEIIPWLEKEMKKQTGGYFHAEGDTVLCERECGMILNVDKTPEQIGILNGTKLMLI